MRSRLVENNQRIYACNRGDTSKSFASCCARTFQKDAGACEAPSKKRMLDTGSETKKIAPMAFKLDWTWIELFLADHVHQEMLQQATSRFQQILRNIAEQIAVQPYAHTSDMLFQWRHAPLASPVVIFSSEDRLHLRVVGGPPSYTWFPVACTCKILQTCLGNDHLQYCNSKRVSHCVKCIWMCAPAWCHTKSTCGCMPVKHD
jgi:hypothetical protein